MKVKRVNILICDGCLNGEGQECHTPECAFWMHDVSTGLVIDPHLYEVIEEFESKP